MVAESLSKVLEPMGYAPGRSGTCDTVREEREKGSLSDKYEAGPRSLRQADAGVLISQMLKLESLTSLPLALPFAEGILVHRQGLCRQGGCNCLCCVFGIARHTGCESTC